MLERWKGEVAAVAGSGAAQSGTAGWLCNRLCSCSFSCTFIPQNSRGFQLQIEFAQRCSAVDLGGEIFSIAWPC